MLEGFWNWISTAGAEVYAIIAAVIAGVAGVLSNLKTIIDFFSGKKAPQPEPSTRGNQNNNTNTNTVNVNLPKQPKPPEDHAYKSKLINGVAAGTISLEEAKKLAYALAGERYENAPPPSEGLPTGEDPAEEFIREFVALATSKNEREREAAALDAEGRTKEALAVLTALAEEEAQQVAKRWNALGAMAFKKFTDMAIESYLRAVVFDPEDAESHKRLGHLYRRIGKLDDADRSYQKVLILGNQQADKNLLAIAYGGLGNVEMNRGNIEQAQAYYKRALTLDEASERREGMAIRHGNLGNVELERGKLEVAELYYKNALERYRSIGNNLGMADQYGNLGILEEMRDNLDAAEMYTQKALSINNDMENEEGIAADYSSLGVIEWKRGNLNTSEEYHKKALSYNKALGSKEGMAIDYTNLGNLEEDRKNFDGAIDYWRKAYDLYAEVGVPHKAEEVAVHLRDAGAPVDGDAE